MEVRKEISKAPGGHEALRDGIPDFLLELQGPDMPRISQILQVSLNNIVYNSIDMPSSDMSWYLL